MPQPSRIRPMARISEKIKVDRLLTTVSGSVAAAKTVVERQTAHTTNAA